MELLAHCRSSLNLDGMQLHTNVLHVLPDQISCGIRPAVNYQM